MKTEHKLYLAIVVLVALGVAVYFTQKGEKQQEQSHVATAASADIPKLSFAKDEIAKITKIEIQNKDKGAITLEKFAAAPKKDEPKPATPPKADAGAADEPPAADKAGKEAKSSKGKDDKAGKAKGKDDKAGKEAKAGKDKGKEDKGKVAKADEPEEPGDEDLGDEEAKADKGGDQWKIVKPLTAEANQGYVKTMLDGLEKLEIQDVITRQADAYSKYDLDGDKAVHLVAYKGADKLIDMYFGKSGSRGQMARINGKDGVFVVKGFQSYNVARELKQWRNTDVWKFEDKNLVSVEVENDNGKFSFSKNDDKWSATFLKRDDKDQLASKADKWDRFDESKVKSMITSFKTLRATDFADKDADTGLADPVKTGGLMVFRFKDNAPDKILRIGKKSKNEDRYAEAQGGDGTIYILSSYTAKWGAAKPSEFEKPDDKDKKGDKDKKPDGKMPMPPPPDEEELGPPE